jgi:hypothetical protein
MPERGVGTIPCTQQGMHHYRQFTKDIVNWYGGVRGIVSRALRSVTGSGAQSAAIKEHTETAQSSWMSQKSLPEKD